MTHAIWEILPAEAPADDANHFVVAITPEAFRQLRAEQDNALLREAAKNERLLATARLHELIAKASCCALGTAIGYAAFKVLSA
ncbi:hypothetical protein [Paraburkholderia sp.]|uniref:hypothetical protein n=1 Tax=Paraburkholderia sp. TaxID=1926495 RepID=UPI00238950C7|nr:hypothetical protein [Paraburkholderia sp.]MDE1179457.1 hypothetical protein [Paraburkholderia sp.]